MYSRETQKLIHWLLTDISNWQNGKSVGDKATDYELYKAKKSMKKHYLKIIGYNPKTDPIDDFTGYIDKLPISQSMKECIMYKYVKSLQDFLISTDDFSLALKAMSQKGASDFTSFLFEFCLENDVPFRKEISTLYAEQEMRKFVYVCLLNKKCVVCGEHADLHHWDNVGTNGYESDTGTNYRILPLCRNHHSLIHNIGNENFYNNYKVQGIFLKENEVPRMKKIYPNHFKGFKGDKNGNSV